jgi:putative colanic acid biosynthesis UDP-glucose lipid carrier transferase
MPERHPIYQRWRLLGAWYRLGDALSIAVGVVIATRREAAADGYPLVAAAAIIVYYLLAELGNMYRNWRGVSAHREAVGTLMCWGCTLAVLLVAEAATGRFGARPGAASTGWLTLGLASGRAAAFSQVSIVTWFAVTPVLMLAVRIATRGVQCALLRWGYNTRWFAIVGVNELAFQLARNIEASPEMGLRLAGFFDDRPEERNPEIPASLGQCLGTLEELVEQARQGRIDRVYITFPMRAEGRIRGVLAKLGDTTASVYVVPDFFVFQLLHSRWTDVLGLPVVSVFETPIYGIDGLAKRLCDLALGIPALLLAALPMALVALAIRLTSAGPVLFRQRRYGLDGREIRVWKFRTMTVCEDGPKAVQARRGDARVTPLGAVLRQLSLDELPQLFNVLGGSMSLVGPRPHPNALNEQFRPLVEGYMLRHKVKPGITGLAQVHGARGETDSPEKMRRRIEFDHRYIREWSLWMDFTILLKTVIVVFSRKNAY